MNAGYLLDRCEHIAHISTLMLASAREGDWQEVDVLKARASIAINEIRALSAIVSLSADEHCDKLASMEQILVNDGKIQELAQPWLKNSAQWLTANTSVPRPSPGASR